MWSPTRVSVSKQTRKQITSILKKPREGDVFSWIQRLIMKIKGFVMFFSAQVVPLQSLGIFLNKRKDASNIAAVARVWRAHINRKFFLADSTTSLYKSQDSLLFFLDLLVAQPEKWGAYDEYKISAK